jgi:hypothetical protein
LIITRWQALPQPKLFWIKPALNRGAYLFELTVKPHI